METETLDFATLLTKKKNGQELNEQEIQFWINGVTNHTIPDYQVTALLMAIYFKGMNIQERSILTRAMANSGKSMDFKDLGKLRVDKHSTGGIGDKTSLIIAPIVAAIGLLNPMVSGRGLGHTGGTIDKLESIPDYDSSLTFEQMTESLKKAGSFICGQTADLAPADKVLYALRDVTQTVNEISLITASILSKKFAEDLNVLTLDIKCGSGAFMTDFKQAVGLGCSLVQTANKGGVKCNGLITRMDFPLGEWVGNSCEVYESLEALQPDSEYLKILKEKITFSEDLPGQIKINSDNIPKSPKEVLVFITTALTLNMLTLTKKFDAKQGLEKIINVWENGSALNQFKAIITNMQGNLDKFSVQNQVILDNLMSSNLNEEDEQQNNQNVFVYRAPIDGKIESIEGQKLGFLMVALGAGRKIKSDIVNPLVSMRWMVCPDQQLKKGQEICRIYHPNAENNKIFEKIQVYDKLSSIIRFSTDSQFRDTVPFVRYVIGENDSAEQILKLQQQ